MVTVLEYIDSVDGVGKEWLLTMMDYMRAKYPDLKEMISYQIPTFKIGKTFISFNVAKEHFSLLSTDFEIVEKAEKMLPKARFSKSAIKVKFSDKDAIPILQKICDEIVARNV